jgi:SAM-dependent methyltransferase
VRDLERYQADYETLPFEAIQARYRRRKILEVLGRFAPRRVLEAGCGLAPLFLDYRDFETFHVVEPAARFHANALRLGEGHVGIQVHRGDLEALAPALAGERFDLIVMSSLLHEMEDPKTLLAAARSLAGELTLLHVNVPNANSLHRILALEMGLIDSVYQLSATQARMQQSATYDIPALSALLQGAGFEVLEAGTFFVKPFTHGQMAAMLEHGILTEKMLDGLYALSARLPAMGSEIWLNAKRAG